MSSQPIPAGRKTRPVVARLTRRDRARVLHHFVALSAEDRRTRFGSERNAEGLGRYVNRIDFERHCVLGATATCGELVGIAHMPIDRGVGELGVSVNPRGRRRGVGLALATQALTEAQRAGAREFRFDYSASNEAMRRIAVALNMKLTRCGSEVSARLQLNDQRYPLLWREVSTRPADRVADAP